MKRAALRPDAAACCDGRSASMSHRGGEARLPILIFHRVLASPDPMHGSGYPHGLQAHEISDLVRITTIVMFTQHSSNSVPIGRRCPVRRPTTIRPTWAQSSTRIWCAHSASS